MRQRPLTRLSTRLCSRARSISSSLDAEGGLALAEGLKGNTSLRELEYAAGPSNHCARVLASLCQRPLTHLLSHRSHPAPRLHSIAYNSIGAEGASALAAILNKTKITSLECAALSIHASYSFFHSCQRLLTLRISNRSLLGNSLGDGADAILSVVSEMPQIITLCGIHPEQTDINFSKRGLDAADAKLLALDLSRNHTVRTLRYALAP